MSYYVKLTDGPNKPGCLTQRQCCSHITCLVRRTPHLEGRSGVHCKGAWDASLVLAACLMRAVALPRLACFLVDTTQRFNEYERASLYKCCNFSTNIWHCRYACNQPSSEGRLVDYAVLKCHLLNCSLLL